MTSLTVLRELTPSLALEVPNIIQDRRLYPPAVGTRCSAHYHSDASGYRFPVY